MQHTIGSAAGMVWRYLEKNGPASPTQMKSDLKLSASMIDRAIGWLARESKIRDEKKGSTHIFYAKE